MKPADRYHKWVEWSEEDQAYLGKCPDLITGIHEDDPIALFSELYQVVEEVVDHLQAEGAGLASATHQTDPRGRTATSSVPGPSLSSFRLVSWRQGMRKTERTDPAPITLSKRLGSTSTAAEPAPCDPPPRIHGQHC